MAIYLVHGHIYEMTNTLTVYYLLFWVLMV